MTLQEMINTGSASIEDIAVHLDGLDPESRVREAFALGRAGQRTLFKCAAEAPPIEFTHFVPDGVDSVQQVRHRGKNTLPLVFLVVLLVPVCQQLLALSLDLK